MVGIVNASITFSSSQQISKISLQADSVLSKRISMISLPSVFIVPFIHFEI